MPKYVRIASHLSLDELAYRYRKATDPVERSHFQMIWLLAQGKRIGEVAEVTGYCPNWIRILARRYNQGGPQMLADKRHQNPGMKPLLSGEQQQRLRESLQQVPTDGGLWSCHKVATWMKNQLGHEVRPQRGWDYLKHLGFSLRVPRPQHKKANRQEQEFFKQQLPEKVEEIAQAQPQAAVELWSFDEHRVGLKPILRRVWTLKGAHPVAVVQHRYQWLYVYGFVQPETGRTSWMLMPTVNSDAFGLALACFAREIGVSAQKQVILVLDRAGWHTSADVRLPEGMHLLYLLPYSPELQPAERLWPLTNESLANQYFQCLDDLEENQVQRCVALQKTPALIHQLTCFHWWPRLPNSQGVHAI